MKKRQEYCIVCYKNINNDQVGYKGQTVDLSTSIDRMLAYYICKDCEAKNPERRLIGGRWHESTRGIGISGL